MLHVVTAASVVTAAERRRSGIICVTHRITHYAAETAIHLKAVNLIAERLDFVGLYKCASGFALSVDCSSDITGLTVNLCAEVSGGKSVITATLCKLFGEVSALGGDVSLHLIAEIADTVPDVRQTVVELTELLTVQDFLLACGGGILTVFALTIPAVAIKSPKEKKENDPPSAAAPSVIIVVVVSDCREVGKRIF